MRSDFIPSDVQDTSERRRQPVAAFNAAPTNPSESFAAILMEPRDLAHQRAQLSSQVAAAPPGAPVSPFKGISAFTGAPAVIPSAVVPPVDALTTSSEVAAPAVDAAPATPAPAETPAFAAAEPTPAEAAPAPATAPATPPAPALATLSGRREPVPAFAAAKPEVATPSAPAEKIQGNAAFGARGLSAEESLAFANGDASSIPKGPSLFGEEGMTVADFFSVINPLQHLPLVGALYRDLTGDTIKPGARVLGGMLFGGPMGMVGGAFNAAVESDIGTDTGGALLALVRGTPLGGTAASPTLAAAARPTPETATATTPNAAQPAANVAAPAPAAAAVAQAPTPAPLPISAPRVMSPPRAITQPAPAEARILPSTPSAAPAVAAEASVEPAKPAVPVSFAPAAAAPAAPAADAKPAGFALSPGGKEFAVPARTNNVQPRQPIPTARADLSRARELAPMAPLTARSDAARPDRSVSPAQLLTPGLGQSDMTPGMPMSGASTTRMPPVSSAPLGVPGLPPSALPDAMTKALDKYDALLKSRKGGVLNQQS